MAASLPSLDIQRSPNAHPRNVQSRSNLSGAFAIALHLAQMAYWRLPEVIAQHAGTLKVLHTLRPFAVAMAGGSEFDPFKD